MLNHCCVCPAVLDRCDRCDLLLDFPGLHLVAVSKALAGLVLEVESCEPVTGCLGCGVIAAVHGRIVAEVIDVPWAGRPVRIRLAQAGAPTPHARPIPGRTDRGDGPDRRTRQGRSEAAGAGALGGRPDHREERGRHTPRPWWSG